MNRRIFNVTPTHRVDVEDLDNQSINQAFEQFYHEYFVNHKLDFSMFDGVVDQFFDEVDSKPLPFTANPFVDCKAAYHDGFFNNFTVAWENELKTGNYRPTIEILRKAVELAKGWEVRTNQHIHKGTPLFFEAVSCIENDEIELGFVLMHEAYLEDLFKNGGDDNFTSPGKSFIEFKEEASSYYQAKLDEVKSFFETEFLSNARLSFLEFNRRFSENGNIPILVKYQFLLNVFRIWKAHKHFGGFKTTNAMLGLLYMEVIFSLSRLIEPIYKAVKDPNPSSNKEVYEKLCGAGTTPNIFNHINVRNFGNTGFMREMQNIYLSKTINVSGTTYALSDKEKDVILAYGFRNLAAHELYEDDFISQNAKGVLQSIFNTLFDTFR